MGIKDKPVTSFPVYINGCFVGVYLLANLFNKFGNEDGDNYLYLACHWYIIDRLREEGFEVRTANTIHNPAIVEIWRDGKKIWESNEFYWYESDFTDSDMAKMWEGLPEEVRRVLRKVADEGIRLSF